MDEILRKLDELDTRLQALEKRLGQPVDAQLGQAAPPPPPPYWMAQEKERSPAGVTAHAAAIPREARDVESYIGRWGLGIVGLVAVVFGASFFLKYVFENNLIGPAGRVAIEVLAGLLFIVVGEWMRSRLPKYSYILSGGGLALFYLSIYGSFHWYHLIGQGGAFGFMSAITAFGVVLAIWTNGLELAVLAVSGGFLTPFLLSTGVSNDFGFFAYLTLLNMGVLAVAFFRKWHALTVLGFAGSVLNFASWYGAFYAPEKLSFTLYTLAIFYAIYLLAGVVANIATRKLSDTGDLFLLTINPAWFFGWYYYLLKPHHENVLGFFAAALAAVYIFFAYIAGVLHQEDKKALLFLGGIALVLLTIAIPLQLDQNAITIAWAVEAAILFFFGLSMKSREMRMFAMGVLVISLIRLFWYDSTIEKIENFLPVFNKRFFTYLMAILATGAMGYMVFLKKEEVSAEERGIGALLGTTINILVLVAVTLEIYSFFDAKIFELNKDRRLSPATPYIYDQTDQDVAYRLGRTLPPSVQYPPAQYDEQYYNDLRSSNNQRNASISVFWTIYAILLITFGVAYRSAFLRWSALALFGVTIIKVFLFDLAALPTPYRIISFTVLGLILLLASYLYFRYEKNLKGQIVT